LPLAPSDEFRFRKGGEFEGRPLERVEGRQPFSRSEL
jgi:hypothetical protein